MRTPWQYTTYAKIGSFPSFSNTRIFTTHIHQGFVNDIENLRISNESKILRFPYAAAWPRMAGYCMMPAAMALAVSSLWAS